MDSNTPIDTASVRALLDSLRASTALQQTITAGTAQGHAESYGEASPAAINTLPMPVSRPENADTVGSRPSTSAPAVSVAALLSQLQASSSLTSPGVASHEAEDSSHDLYVHASVGHALVAQQVTPSQPAALIQDPRTYTFQQALPHLSRLSEDQTFLKAARALKHEQEQLEKRLWEERQMIQRKHEEKVKIAQTKASMIGAGLTQYEADTMTDSFRRELQKFDAERVLPAWDGLIAKQQTTLESFGVPTMYLTTVPADRERQQRVMQVLVNFLE